MSPRPAAHGLALLLALAPLACAGPPPAADLEPAYELAANLPTADVVREVDRLELGSPAARPYLERGWGHPEGTATGGPGFVWNEGDESELTFPLLVARDLELTLTCQPFSYPGAPQQEMTVLANGFEVARLTLAPGWREHRVALPADRLEVGRNRLLFRYRHTRAPRDVIASADSRPLAVAWTGLGFADALPAAAGEPRADGDRLLLPTGSELGFYVELPAGSVLAVDGWSWRGTTEPRLEVGLTTEAEGERRLATWSGTGGGAQRLTLPVAGRTVARLSLRALGSAADADGGVLLGAAKILVPAVRSAAAPPTLPARSTGGTVRRPNILVYLVDTLRADHLGCYGYDRPVSPRLDELARQATLFEHPIAQSSWTRASVASIFTGVWPPEHGANLRGDVLGDEATTLAERLSAVGYHTAAVVGNPNVARAFGFAQGFDDFVLKRRNDSESLTDEVFTWLDGYHDERPFFLYVQTVDPHDPYDPPAAFRARFAPDVPPDLPRTTDRLLRELRTGERQVSRELIDQLLALYDAEIAANDAQLGRLLDRFRELGLYDDTVIVFLSDHGEEFHEHGGWAHGGSLHSELIEVPLVVRLPRQAAAQRIAEPVQHIDLVPTLLELAGAPAAAGLEGRSLLGLMAAPAARAPWPERRIYSYLHIDQVNRPREAFNTFAGVVDGDWKLSQRLSAGEGDRLELYRWRDDRSERRNLAGAHPLRGSFLERLLAERLRRDAARAPAEQAVVDRELEESLRALGYVQ